MTDIIIVVNNEYSEMRESAVFDFSEKQEFVNSEDFTHKYFSPQKYATLERKRWLLDGTFEAFPDDISDTSIGYMSVQLSQNSPTDTVYNESYLFETPIVITRTWDTAQNSEELNIIFDEESYCNYLNVEYFDIDGNSLFKSDFYPDSAEFNCEISASDFYSIKITFYGMNKANRYLRIYDFFDGGINKFSKFTKDKLFYVNFNANCHPSGVILPSGTLELNVKSKNIDYIQQYDTIDVYLNFEFYMRYYVKTTSYKGKNVYSIYCQDMLEIFASEEIGTKGIYTNDSTVKSPMNYEQFANKIQSAFFSNIVVPEELKDVQVKGTIYRSDELAINVFQGLALKFGFGINLIGSKSIYMKPIDEIIEIDNELQFNNIRIENSDIVAIAEYSHDTYKPNTKTEIDSDGFETTRNVYTLLGEAFGEQIIDTIGNLHYKYDTDVVSDFPIYSNITIRNKNGLVLGSSAPKWEITDYNRIKIKDKAGDYPSVYVWAQLLVKEGSIEYKQEFEKFANLKTKDNYTYTMGNILFDLSEDDINNLFKMLNSKKIYFDTVYSETLLNKKVMLNVDNKQLLCIPTSAICTWYGNKLKCEYEGLVIEE